MGCYKARERSTVIETFLLLLAGHLLGDFVFQSDALIARKQTLRGLADHVAIVTVLTLLMLAPTRLSILGPVAIMAASHFAMDWLKVHRLGDRLWAFGLDQAVHIAVLVGLAVAWPAMASQSLWGLQPSPVQVQIYAALAVLCGGVVAVWVGGVVIKKLVEPLSPAGRAANTLLTTGVASGPIVGMPNAGKYIGWLERGLTLTFILIGHPEGVGFLLAAKSILRFRDVQDQNDRHQAEYIIIGTFLSFGWALAVALATQAAVLHWLPKG
ncbi:hypothetical protein HMPREF0185_00920 [Brevundimonas diminuta 470-4]|jgi:hypothetical protein|nr:hypothetical protein HMPREF0185_00920 [Brevundimonas diminuta 470-4]